MVRHSARDRVVLWIKELLGRGLWAHGMAVIAVVKPFYQGVCLTQRPLAAQRATINGPVNYFINPEQLLHEH